MAQDSSSLCGHRVLVTGATGQFGYPLSLELAAKNEVFAAARFTDEERRVSLEAAGATIVPFDLLDDDLDRLPERVDYVFHTAAMMPAAYGRQLAQHSETDRAATFVANAQAPARLMRRYKDASGFLHSSSAGVYAYQGERRMREDDPFGALNGMETYGLSKIASESVVAFASEAYQLPTVMLRIFHLNDFENGAIARRTRMVANGEPVVYFGSAPEYISPIFPVDYVPKAIAAIQLGTVPALAMNFGGSETITAPALAQLVARMLGVGVELLPSDAAMHPLWPDLELMEKLVGPTSMPIATGVERIVERLRILSR